MGALCPNPEVRLPSPSSVEQALIALHRALGGSKLMTQAESCEAYRFDESEAEGLLPAAVIQAHDVKDAQTVLEIAERYDVPVTPRGGGTSRVGGAVPLAGGFVLEFQGMNQIKEIDRREQLAVVEAGTILGTLHSAVEAEGLFFPPDANSLANCTLGGNAAANAGGPRALKYGVTRDYVLGVEALLMGGRRLKAGRRTKKGVTGYDVVGLLVGSEGTLAVFSELTLRLLPKPPSVMTLMALFNDVHHSGRCVEEIIASGLMPRCIELLDSGTLQAMRAAGNPINAAAGALLLIEVDGTETAVEQAAERIANVCEDVGAMDLLVAQDAAQRDRLWAARRDMSPAVRQMAAHKLSEDIVVPRQAVGELLQRVDRAAERFQVKTVTYGHAGDGNLHVNFLWDTEDEETRVASAVEQLFRDTIALRGSLSGEHGIGVTKAPYLHLEQSPELIELQRRIKDAFDPRGLLNPGKIFTGQSHHGPC